MGKELANETYLKSCNNCRKKISKPIFHKGYVFCSDTCRDVFVSKLTSKR